jgi:hypothetical protein
MEEYNQKFSKNEEHKQFTLQVNIKNQSNLQSKIPNNLIYFSGCSRTFSGCSREGLKKKFLY